MMRHRSYSRSLLATVFVVVGLFCLMFLCCPPLGQSAFSAEMAETDSFEVVAQRAESLAEKYGPREVLLVCDIDNTILTMNQELGSVAWFDDQARLLRNNPQSEELVAKDFSSLLRVQRMLFVLSRMHPPENTIPDKITALQKKGVYVICLTSRGPAYRNATEDALRRNRYDLARGAPKVVDRFRGETIPYKLDKIAASGISREEANRFRLGEPRLVSYDKGLFMVSGQNKGAMLLILLAHCSRRFSAVVFVDDKEQHVKDVFTAVVARGVEIVAYRYSREDHLADLYKKSGHQKAHEQWKKLDGVLGEVFQ